MILRGLGLNTGSGARQAFKSTLTAIVPLSTNFTFSDFELVTGPAISLGIRGLKNAALYLMIKMCYLILPLILDFVKAHRSF